MKKSYDFKTIKYLANSINPNNNNKEFLIDKKDVEELYIVKSFCLFDVGNSYGALVEINKALKINTNNKYALAFKNQINNNF